MKVLAVPLANFRANSRTRDRAEATEVGMSIEGLLSIEAAAVSLSISPWTVRAFIRQGKIRVVRLGRRVLIEPKEIRRIIEQGRDKTGNHELTTGLQ